jgi:hypothetical protein
VKILFDQGTPAPLRNALRPNPVSTAFELGWQKLQNGDLLAAAEGRGFDVLVTTDQNLRYQQNLVGRRLAIVVLLTTNWPLIRQHVDTVSRAVTDIARGGYVELAFPPPNN